MKILVFADNVPIDDLIDSCEIMLTISNDKKSFEIDRHTALSNTRLYLKNARYGHRHISELKNILLAEKKENKNV